MMKKIRTIEGKADLHQEKKRVGTSREPRAHQHMRMQRIPSQGTGVRCKVKPKRNCTDPIQTCADKTANRAGHKSEYMRTSLCYTTIHRGTAASHNLPCKEAHKRTPESAPSACQDGKHKAKTGNEYGGAHYATKSPLNNLYGPSHKYDQQLR